MFTRKLANIYIPPVDVLDDVRAVEELLELHIEQKRLFSDLVAGGINHQEILEALEAYIGISQMDEYIASTEQQLDELEQNVLWLSN